VSVQTRIGTKNNGRKKKMETNTETAESLRDHIPIQSKISGQLDPWLMKPNNTPIDSQLRLSGIAKIEHPMSFFSRA
jgi:hypothetical protein